MAAEKKHGNWMGHPLIQEGDAHELHLASAIHEFQGGMPRHEAEQRALEDYRREHHARAAAHHFQGMKAGHATGNMEDAQKHHALYSLHVKALGEDPMGPVPETVRKYRDSAGQDSKQRHVYSFRGHDADQFLVKPVTKSECAFMDLQKSTPVEALMAAANQVANGIVFPEEYIRELAGVPAPAEEVVPASVVEKSEPKDPVAQAAQELRKTLDTLSLLKNVLGQLQAKQGH